MKLTKIQTNNTHTGNFKKISKSNYKSYWKYTYYIFNGIIMFFFLHIIQNPGIQNIILKSVVGGRLLFMYVKFLVNILYNDPIGLKSGYKDGHLLWSLRQFFFSSSLLIVFLYRIIVHKNVLFESICFCSNGGSMCFFQKKKNKMYAWVNSLTPSGIRHIISLLITHQIILLRWVIGL